MRAVIFILILKLSAFAVSGQNDTEQETDFAHESEEGFGAAELQPATNAVHRGEAVAVRPISPNTVREVTGGIDYNEKQPEQRDKKQEEKEATSAPTSISVPWGGEALRWIGYILIAAAVVYFLIVIIRNTSPLRSNPRMTIRPEATTQHVENIEELEIDRLMREARESGDYRLMVRIQYLALLKTLNGKGLIKWERDKTNREYMMELLSREIIYHDFRKLTLAYETVWYGEHPIDSTRCQSIMGGFDQIQQQLSTRAR